jgi:uncharacterized protein (PEP-CTERM system associated)
VASESVSRPVTTGGGRGRGPGCLRLGRLPVAAALVLGGLAASGEVLAQGGGGALSTSISAEETYLDVRGRPLGANGGEFITRVTPALRYESRGGRLVGSVAYSASLIHRTGRESSDSGEVLHALSANLSAEAVPRWAFVDANASISQQSISAFDRPADSSSLANANRTELRTLSLSPYVRGPLAGVADYELRLTATATDSSAANAANASTTTALVSVSSAGRSRLGWALNATRQRSEFEQATRATVNDRVNGSLIYTPDIDWRLTVNAGSEANDIGGVVRERYDNYGASVQWTPSPRTTVVAGADERYFGQARRISVQHRMARFSLSYSDTRDVGNGSGGLGGGAAGGGGTPVTLYQLLFQQLATQYPDPVIREQQVLALLQLNNRSPNETVAGGAVNTGISLTHRRDLTLGWNAPRLVIGVQAFTSDQRRIDSSVASTASGDVAATQSGYSANASYRLTPLSGVSLSGGRTITQASATQAGTDQKTAGLSFTTQLGHRTTGALTARYTVFNSPTNPSRETSLSASASLRF